MTVVINTALQNRQVDSAGDDLDSGFIDIYTGAKPGPNDAPTGTLLVSIALEADAYAAGVAGVASILGAVSGVAVANGTAGYAQQRNAANTRWMYGTVTASGGGGDVELDPVVISVGNIVSIVTSTLTQPSGA